MNKCIKQYLEQNLLATAHKLGRRERTLKKQNNLSLPVFGLLKTHKYCLHWNGELCLCMSKAAWRFSQCCKIFPVSDSNVV